MLGADGTILYVGKAKSLRDRVGGSYFLPSNVIPKVQTLVAQIASMEVTVTRSETEALLLEHNLIKAHRPRYNVVLRDDKSFPYLWLSQWPRVPTTLDLSRFAQFAGSGISDRTRTRAPSTRRCNTCKKFFACAIVATLISRIAARPCLQHQIGRCSAPCVAVDRRCVVLRARRRVRRCMVLEGRDDRGATRRRWTGHGCKSAAAGAGVRAGGGCCATRSRPIWRAYRLQQVGRRRGRDRDADAVRDRRR
jgi:excinuclease ABC subunit C